MLIRIHKNILKAQSLSEYAMILSLIAIIFSAMHLFTKRAIQGVVKYSADQIAFQSDAAEEQDPLKGHLISVRTPIVKEVAVLAPNPADDYTYRVKEDDTSIEYQYNEQTRISGGEATYVLGAQEKELSE